MDGDEIELEDDIPAALDARPVLALDKSMREIDLDGHMHVEVCNISKANVCPYFGREIPNGKELGLEPDRIYYLYRDAAELEAAAPTYENKPLMMKHVGVSATDPQQEFIAGTISKVYFQYPYLKASVGVWTQEGIDAIASRDQEQLSCGYRYSADMSPGEINGEKYDGVMRGLACNHVALVSVGRAGPDVLVSDELPQDFPEMKISALVKALAPVLAVDAKPADVQALVVQVLAQDKKAKDKDLEDKDQPSAQDTDKDGKACADDADPEKGDPNDATDEEDPDMDAEDEDEPKSPEGGAKKPFGKDKKGMDKKAMDKAINSALTARDALHAARKDVESIIGATSFDSAGATYGAALKKLGIDTAGVDVSAYGALLKIARSKGTDPLATDAAAGASSFLDSLPKYNRLSR